jgi:hypothetical protein
MESREARILRTLYEEGGEAASQAVVAVVKNRQASTDR